MKESTNVKQLLQEELDKRIEIMESPDYEYVPRLNKKDYIGMAVVALVCAGIIVIGII